MPEDLAAKKLYLLEQIANDMIMLLDEGFITDPDMRAREYVWLGELEAVNEQMEA